MWIEFNKQLLNIENAIAIAKHIDCDGKFFIEVKFARTFSVEMYETEKERDTRYEELKSMLIDKPKISSNTLQKISNDLNEEQKNVLRESLKYTDNILVKQYLCNHEYDLSKSNKCFKCGYIFRFEISNEGTL